MEIDNDQLSYDIENCANLAITDKTTEITEPLDQQKHFAMDTSGNNMDSIVTCGTMCVQDDKRVDSVIKHKCEPCTFDDQESVANAFCVICIEFLCTNCARDHRRSKLTRQHKVLNDKHMPQNTEVFKRMKELSSCPDHPEMRASYKCNDHNSFICTTCVAVNHRKCDNVSEVSRCVTDAEDIGADKTLTDRLRLILEKAFAIRAFKEENSSLLSKDKTEIDAKRTLLKENVSLHIEDLCELSNNETEILVTKEMEEIRSEVKAIEAIEKEGKMLEELLLATLQHGSLIEMCIVTEKMLDSVLLLEKETEKQNLKPSRRLEFSENSQFLTLSPIGYVSAKTNDLHESITQAQFSSDYFEEESNKCNKENEPRDPMKREIGRRLTKYDTENATHSSQSTISSILFLKDGRIVIMDKTRNCLKVLNADYSVKKTHCLGHTPIDMCEVSEKIVVVFESVTQVKRYSLRDENIYECGGFPTKMYALSIATFDSEELTVAILFSDEQLDTPKNSKSDTIELQIRSCMNGQIIHTFSDFKAKLSTEITITNPNRINVAGKEKKHLLMTEKDKLHCFEMEGSTLKEVWFYKSYTGAPVSNITDIAVDIDDNVYIVCSESQNLHQISAKSFRKHRILTSKLNKPVSLCIDKSGTQILVGCEDDDYLCVYQFT